MKSLWDEEGWQHTRVRLHHLHPETKARWGKLTPHRMICHLSDALRMALGEHQPKSIARAFHYQPLKLIGLYVLPFPKNATAPPEGFSMQPTEWNRDLAELDELHKQCAKRLANDIWGYHPYFGHCSKHEWGLFQAKHFDHHLRQFGC